MADENEEMARALAEADALTTEAVAQAQLADQSRDALVMQARAAISMANALSAIAVVAVAVIKEDLE